MPHDLRTADVALTTSRRRVLQGTAAVALGLAGLGHLPASRAGGGVPGADGGGGPSSSP